MTDTTTYNYLGRHVCIVYDDAQPWSDMNWQRAMELLATYLKLVSTQDFGTKWDAFREECPGMFVYDGSIVNGNIVQAQCTTLAQVLQQDQSITTSALKATLNNIVPSHHHLPLVLRGYPQTREEVWSWFVFDDSERHWCSAWRHMHNRGEARNTGMRARTVLQKGKYGTNKCSDRDYVTRWVDELNDLADAIVALNHKSSSSSEPTQQKRYKQILHDAICDFLNSCSLEMCDKADD